MLTLQGGQSARCAGLTKGELYVALLYNSSPHDQTASVIVVWNNKIPPARVDVPGTTGSQGPAGMVFVSGTDTDFITLSRGATRAATVDIVMVSVSMPANPAGINDRPLLDDGELYPFPKYTRYHAVPEGGWSELSLASPVTQFISIKMSKTEATIIILNIGTGTYQGQVRKFGDTATTKGVVRKLEVPHQTYTDTTISGDGSTMICMSADSEANAKDAKIALQHLSLAAAMVSVTTNLAVRTYDNLRPSALKARFSKHND